nr:uncharacterized protein LOC113804348 [Penaeus vannamei]
MRQLMADIQANGVKTVRCVALTSSAWTLRSVYSVVFTRRALWRKIQCSVIAAPSSTAPLQTEPLPTILLMLLTGLKLKTKESVCAPSLTRTIAASPLFMDMMRIRNQSYVCSRHWNALQS